MRLTEAQIRRTVRSILMEAHVLPDLPQPDPGLGKVIDIIGLKVKRAAESDPEFIAIQDELKLLDPNAYSSRHTTRRKAMFLIPDTFGEEIEKISRVMLGQAKKLVPTIMDDMKEITGRMSPEQIHSAFSQFEEGISRFALEDVPAQGLPHTTSYTAGFEFERLNNTQFAVVEELLTYIFPVAPPVSRLSELTDRRVYNTILRIYGYYPPETRDQRERDMDEDDADPNQQFDQDDPGV